MLTLLQYGQTVKTDIRGLTAVVWHTKDMFIVKYDIVLRGQVVRPAVKKPLPLHSGRNLPLGQEAPPTVLWEEPGGCYFAQENDY